MATNRVYRVGKRFPNRLFIGGIPFGTTAGQLAEFFSRYGNIREAKIIVDESGLSKGYGFVTFDSESAAVAVSQMGTIFFGSKKLNIGPAVKKEGPNILPEPVVVPPSPWPFANYQHPPETYAHAPVQWYPSLQTASASVYPTNAVSLYPNTVMLPVTVPVQPYANVQPTSAPIIQSSTLETEQRQARRPKMKYTLAPRFVNKTRTRTN